MRAEKNEEYPAIAASRNIKEELAVAASQNIKERDYWLAQLSGNLTKTSFPYQDKKTGITVNYPRNKIFRFHGEIFSKLMSLAKNSDHLLHMIMVSATAALLHKYTGNRDILVGSPTYKQAFKGVFINTVLVLRNRPEPHMTFKELLFQVKETIVKASENQNYPLEILLDKLNVSYSAGEAFPLFDIVVLVENIHDKKDIRHISPNVTLGFTRKDGAVEGVLEYNSILYREDAIVRIISHFENLLEKVLLDIDVRLSGIDILSDEEKKQLLFTFNDTKSPYPGDKTIAQLFAEQVERTPDNVAVIGAAQVAGAQEAVPLPVDHVSITYRELHEKSDRLAGTLKQKGVKADTIIGIMLESSIEMIVGILAILKAGGAYLPIDPGLPGNRISYMLEDSQANLLLTKLEVLDNKPFTPMQSLNRSNGTQPYVTRARPQIMDIEGIGIPDRSLVDYEKYNRYLGQSIFKNYMTLQATRGCPYKCMYCHKIWPKRNVVRSARHIFEEIKLYYDMGVRRFAFIDDIFNLNIKNSRRFFELVIENGLDIQISFPNGVRGDILTKEYIDIMVKAGTIQVAFALETASPRLQKLIGKNLILEKFKENVEYVCQKYPHVIIELFTMHGFPTETEEEAMMTLDFIKSIKWLHFPYVFVLRVFPNSDMEKLALESGISRKAIIESADLYYHDLPTTLPFDKNFTMKYQAQFTNDYFLSKERLLHVLPYQIKVLTENEIVQKYDSYLPTRISTLKDLLDLVDIKEDELDTRCLLPEDYMEVPNLNAKIKRAFPGEPAQKDALKVLLLDLSQYFSGSSDQLNALIDPPMGLMYLLSHLKRKLGGKVKGKIAKSFIDFDNYTQLKTLLEEFKPEVIGLRTLSIYKDFFHKTISLIRQWGYNVPVIVGGPYPTSEYNTILQDENIDCVVLGEGEITFVEIIEKIIENGKKIPGADVLKDVAGVAFNPNGRKDRSAYSREIMMLDQARDILEKENPGYLIKKNEPGDLAYVIYTSGTTGQPKGTLVEHRSLVNLCFWHNSHFGVTEKDRATHYAGIGFDATVWEIFPYLVKGASLHIIADHMKLDIPKLSDYYREHQITISFLPTQFCQQFMEESGDIGSLRALLTGGDKLNRFVETDYRLHNNYGPTENTVVTTSCPVEAYTENIPIGKPIANSRVYILDKDNLRPQPLGAAGELCIAGDSLSRGYLNRPELTAEKFIRLPYSPTHPLTHSTIYRTGDLARWLPDGNIEFLGRIDQQVKIRGFRIELGEIERQLAEHREIREAVVVLKGEQEGDKHLCAYVVLAREGAFEDTDSMKKELTRYLSLSLSYYMIPSFFIQLDKIPLTPNNKIDKKKLPDPVKRVSGKEWLAAADRDEKKLVELWSEVLKIEKEAIGVDSNFFDLGGHSLNATLMISKIHKEMKVKVPLEEVFSNPTIRQLSGYIKGAGKDEYIALGPVEKKEYYALSAAQKRMYILYCMDKKAIGYNMAFTFILDGKLDVGKFSDTLKTLIDRHESLRTSFEMVNEIPVQRVHDRVEFEIRYYDLAPGDTGKIKPADFFRPFDLSKAPLMLFGMIKIRQDRHLLLADMHHIISDGISMDLFINEFMTLYRGEELPEIRLQYKDFSAWQNKLLRSGEIERQEEYWIKLYEGDILKLELPTDFQRSRAHHFEGKHLAFELSRDETAALNRLALNEGVTLYMLLLAIYNVFLSKISSQEDILVGISSAGRRHADLAPVFGMFVNTLCMRNYPGAERTFGEFLTEVKQRTLQAFENQDYQFEDLVEKFAIKRVPGGNPLFNVSFSFNNEMQLARHLKIEIPGLKLRPYESEVAASNFDLTLRGLEIDEKLLLSFHYRTALFEKETIEMYTIYFKRILSSVIENPKQRIYDIKIISKPEKQAILSRLKGNRDPAAGIWSRDELPIRRPILGGQALILDKYRDICAEKTMGEIYIRIPAGAPGNDNSRGISRECFIPNPFTANPNDILYKTGHRGRMLPDGNIECFGGIGQQPGIKRAKAETVKEKKEPAAPANEIERTLVKTWSDVLEIDETSIGVDDSFTDLDGQSLKAIMLASWIHKEFNVSIPIHAIFELSTIKRMAEYIEKSNEDKYHTIEPAEQKDYYALSPGQKRLYIIWQMEMGSTGYNVPQMAALEGNIDIEKLESTFNKLINLHESFRTSFKLVEGEPVQRVHETVDFSVEYYDRTAGVLKKITRSFIRPFNLEEAPLLRVGVTKIDERKYVLMADMHHIISDAASRRILLEDFLDLYEGKELPHLRLQYKDYSEWINGPTRRAVMKQEELYWLGQFEEEVPVLNVPTDFPRPTVRDYEGGRVFMTIGKEGTTALRKLAMEENATLFMVLLAAFKIFLAKISDQEDIVVGTPVVGRRHTDLEKIIGIFINTLALRSYPRGEKTYKEFLSELRRRSFEAFENQHYQFEDLVDRVSIKRDASRNPLFDVVFSYEEAEEHIEEMSRMDVSVSNYESLHYEHIISKFDLLLSVVDGEELHFIFEYWTKLFEKEAIERFTAYFKKILKHIIHEPGINISEIEILSEEEKIEILYGFNDTRTGYPGDKTIHQLFEEQAAGKSDSVAVVGAHESQEKGEETISITYGELNRKANRLARVLREKGVQPDSIVGLMVERSLEMIIGIFAILKAGGAYLPIDPAHPEDRIRYLLNDSKAKILLSELSEVSKVSKGIEVTGVNSAVGNRPACPASEGHLRLSPASVTSLAYVIFTSGSTGSPKGTLTTHANAIRVVKETNYLDLTPADRVLQLSNYAFDGSVFDIYGALLNGAALAMIKKEDVLSVDRLSRTITRQAITVFFVTTALFNTIVDMNPQCLSGIRKVLFGGERVSVEHSRKALQFLGKNRVIHVYGPTETTVYATYYHIDHIDENQHTIPIGYPLANTTAYILDKSGRLVPIGVSAELYIGGDGLARGYLNNPELTAERFVSVSYISEKIYKTGDLARWLPGGSIEFIGRIDQQVKIRGFRIEPGEVESHILNHREIKDAVVIPYKNKTGEVSLCAYIVFKSRETENRVPELKLYLSRVLPDYMIPLYFVSLDRIPLTPNGKIDRKSLPAPALRAGENYTAPRDDTEKRMVGIWSEVLGVERNTISIDTDFFELGGHSLKATLLAARIHKEFNVKIPLVDIFKTPFIRDMADYIKQAEERNEHISVENAEEKEYYRLSPAQKRLYIIEQTGKTSTNYNVSLPLILEGHPDLRKLEEIFRDLINRHESLRTSFHLIENKPVQKVHDRVEFAIRYFEIAAGNENLERVMQDFVQPFDLTRPPLLKAGMIKLKEDRYLLVIDMHHIVTDGTSVQVMVDELTALYMGKELPKIRLQYKDFSGWQNKLLLSGEIKRQEEYWLKLYEGKIPRLDLPGDFERPRVQNFAGGEVSFELGIEETAALNRLAREEGATLYMLLLALYNVFLGKLSHQKDILVGTSVAGRCHADLEPVLGMFVNTLCLRNFPGGEHTRTFGEFLQDVKQRTLQAFENQDYQFEDLVEKLPVKRVPGENPLFNVSFSFHNEMQSGEISEIDFPGFKLKPYNSGRTASKFDLTLKGVEINDRLFFSLSYNTALFRKESIEMFIEYFKRIVSSVIENPGQRISGIKMISGEKEQDILSQAYNDLEDE
jgi:amino acid adenylation domain-containing protein